MLRKKMLYFSLDLVFCYTFLILLLGDRQIVEAKKSAACAHIMLYSKETSASVAPILFIATKPFMAGVDGNIYENTFQKSGTLLPGHDIPERKSSGIEVKTNRSIALSRLCTMRPNVIARNMQASR